MQQEGSTPADEPAEVDSYNQPLTPEGIQQATGKATDAGKLASPRQVETGECCEKMKIIAGKNGKADAIVDIFVLQRQT